MTVVVVGWTGAEEVASVMVTSLLLVAAVVVTATDAAGAAVGVVGCVAVAVAPSFFNAAL